MDINAIPAGSSVPGISPKKAADSLGLSKALHQGALVSGLLPALPSASGPAGSSGHAGLGDIYTAVGMQTQGMMSRGLMGIQIANISLGIDMSQAVKEAGAAKDTDAGKDAVAEKDAGKDAEKTPESDAEKASAQDGAPDPEATRYYSNPDLANPGLGGLLNSLG